MGVAGCAWGCGCVCGCVWGWVCVSVCSWVCVGVRVCVWVCVFLWGVPSSGHYQNAFSALSFNYASNN